MKGRGRKEREVKARNAGHVKQFRGKRRGQEVAAGHVWGLNRSGKGSVKIFREYIKENKRVSERKRERKDEGSRLRDIIEWHVKAMGNKLVVMVDVQIVPLSYLTNR